MKEFKKVLKLPVFNNYKITIICTDDVAESWRKKFPGQDDEITHGALALTSRSKNGHSIMFFPKDVGGGTIAHECWHVINAVFTWAGVRDYEDEIVAYHLGWLTSAAIRFLLATEPKFNAPQPTSKEGQCQTHQPQPPSKTPRKLQLKQLTPQSGSSSGTKSETKKSRRTRSSSYSKNTA
jgi:hypothetical protein